MRVDDRIRKTVVFIGRADNGPFVPYGTGFITATLHSEDQAWQSLVTARHVIDDIGGDRVHVRLNNHNGEARIIEITKDFWVPHPDGRIDVAVSPTIIPRDQFDIIHYPLGGTAPGMDCKLTNERIAEYHVGIGDEVYLAGMFVSHIGENSNLPILRIGTIAAMPAERIQTEYGHHEAFLVEVRSIDGLSGSPVCVHMPPERTTVPVPPWLFPDPRYQSPTPPTYFLAGMILGYNAVYNPRDTIEIKGRAGSSDMIEAAVPLNTGIAVVLPIWRIIEAIDQPLIREKREAVLNASNREKGRGFVATSAAPIAMQPQEPPRRTRRRRAR